MQKYNRFINSVFLKNLYFCSFVAQDKSALTPSAPFLLASAYDASQQSTRVRRTPQDAMQRGGIKDAEAIAALEIKVLAAQEAA